MCIKNRQTVRCQRCSAVIKTNLILEQVCDRVRGPHLRCDNIQAKDTEIYHSQCNKCLGYNGAYRVPPSRRPNLQGLPPQSGNRALPQGQPSSGTNNAGRTQPSTERPYRDQQFAAPLFPRRSDLPPQTARIPASQGQSRAAAAVGPINFQAHGQIGTIRSSTSSNLPPRVAAPEAIVASITPLASGRPAYQTPPRQNEQRHANTPAPQQAGNLQIMTGSPLTLPRQVDELSQQDARILRMIAEFEGNLTYAEGRGGRLDSNNQGVAQRVPETTGDPEIEILSESDNELGTNAPGNDDGTQEGSKRRTRRGTRAGRQVQIRRELAMRQQERRQHQASQPGLPMASEFRPAQPPAGPRNHANGPRFARPNGPGAEPRRFR